MWKDHIYQRTSFGEVKRRVWRCHRTSFVMMCEYEAEIMWVFATQDRPLTHKKINSFINRESSWPNHFLNISPVKTSNEFFNTSWWGGLLNHSTHTHTCTLTYTNAYEMHYIPEKQSHLYSINKSRLSSLDNL